MDPGGSLGSPAPIGQVGGGVDAQRLLLEKGGRSGAQGRKVMRVPARVLGSASGLLLARGSPLCFYAGLLGGSGKLFH